MKKVLLLIALAFCIAKEGTAQNHEIDSLTFSTAKGLLIFEGYLNDVKTNFAFDTGAAMGVLNSKNVSDSDITRKGSTKINDSQRNSAKLDLAKINNLKIGTHSLQNITSVVADMPFLYCNTAYLLGGDVINKLNWKFDFKKNRVYISKTPFAPENDMQEMPVKIIGKRHFSPLVVQGTVIDNVLIDFGFAGNCTMDLKFSSTKEIMSKILPENIYASKSSSMGLNSISVGKTTSSFFLDSVIFGGVVVNNFKVNAMNDTQNKIGLLFLKMSFNQMILNNTELKYWLQPSHVAPQKQTTFDAGFYLNDKNKIEVVSLNGAAIHTAQSLNIGQTIKELNGRSAESFADKCAFLNWYAEQVKKEEFAVVTEKGEKLIIRKSVF
ncbi:retropepsin-like aspartic protease [Pedobacter sp. KLB.chiD]|uniref:retropepsin-like aspartic protease n=1 Tax=Pedobacter sp. KLB.chiD TaxID=3387402 RepID=UPI00399A09E1